MASSSGRLVQAQQGQGKLKYACNLVLRSSKEWLSIEECEQ